MEIYPSTAEDKILIGFICKNYKTTQIKQPCFSIISTPYHEEHPIWLDHDTLGDIL